MQKGNYVIVDKGDNYVAMAKKSNRNLSAKKRKEAKMKAGKVIIYGVNENEYQRLQSTHENLLNEKLTYNTRKLRFKLFKEAIKKTLIEMSR